MKKILRIGLFAAASIIIVLILLIVVLLIQSPGKVRPFMTQDGKAEPGSIAVIETVNINSLNQRMIIRGRDTTKPVLLYLHGGPGSPEFPFVRQFNSGLEDMFIVCYWDQRGAGLSYHKDIPAETMTISQFVDDAAEVSKYLIRKFHHEKIYLLGHSWGTLLGSFTVNKYPEYYYALISIGQVAQQERSEIISYNFVLSRARELKDHKAIKALEKIGPPPYLSSGEGIDKMMKERKYVTRYGGAVKNGNFYAEAVKALFNCREYSFRDKINYMKGMKFTLKYFWELVMKTDLFHDIPSQQVPVYIMQGTSDYQTTYIVAREYFDSLKAPVKQFFSFENSAHSPIFEEPEKFEKILKEILSEQQNK
jgi:pimeloyl-ACP methyl ester carboxylesterase